MSAFALNDPQSRSFARTTGAMYLAIAVAGGFSIGFAPSQITVTGDIAATLSNIATRRGLFLAGLGGDAVIMLAEVMATALLFLMFRPVSEAWSLAAAFARLTMTTVMAAMWFFHIALLAIASGTLTAGPQIAELLLYMHDAGVWIWQIFFGLHLLILGQLVARSGQYPVWLGHAMSLGAFGYFADTLQSVAFAEASALNMARIGLLVVVTLAEVGFALWLLTVGPRTQA